MATRVVDMTAIRTREQNVAVLLQAKAMQEDAAEQKIYDLFPCFTRTGNKEGTHKNLTPADPRGRQHTNAARIKKVGKLVRVKPMHKSL